MNEETKFSRRLFKNPSDNRIKKWGGRGLSVAAILAIAYLISPHEGRVKTVYLDPVGIPTVCDGQTGYDLYGRKIDINKGLVYTDEECDLMLSSTVKNSEGDMLSLVKPNNSPLAIVDGRFTSEYQKAAITSFVYNVGLGNFKSSTLLRKLNNGDHAGACDQLIRWVYAQGKKLNGLVSRRGEERQWCLGNVPWEVKESKTNLYEAG